MNDKEKMELFKKKTPGKWDVRTIAVKDVMESYAGDRMFCVGSKAADAVIALTDDCDNIFPSGDTEFIAAASEGWPEDFFGRLVAERKNKILLEWLSDAPCPFKALEKNRFCDGSCPKCVADNIDGLALASLAAEGIKVEEGTK